MPDPGVQRGGDTADENDRGEFDASVEATGVDLNAVAAAISEGPLGSLGIGGIGRTLLGAVIPGIGIPDVVHGLAKSLGGGIRSVLDALGLETTAPAIELGLNEPLGDGTDNKFNKLVQPANQFSGFQNNSAGPGLAAGLTLGAGSALLPALKAFSGSGIGGKETSEGVGNQILKQAGAEKLKEMLAETTGGSASEKATPTQQTNKPVAQAQKSREEGRSDFEKMFLELINGQLNVQS